MTQIRVQLTSKEVDAFRRHLEMLGLETVEAYQGWCRDHGFDVAVKKHWRERRKEALAAKRLSTKDQEEEGLMAHISAMGMKNTTEYQIWCRKNGFNAKLYKTDWQRVRERKVLGNLRMQAERAGGMRHTRQSDTLQQILVGSVQREDLPHPYLKTIYDISAELRQTGQKETGQAFEALLEMTEQKANFFNDTPVIGHLGPETGNTFVEGLYAMARYHRDWIRDIDSWSPDTHDPHQQFGLLARHLFAKYMIPGFMDSAWFRGTSPMAVQQQAWFKHIGQGDNIRTADIPVQFSKMMAHHFLQAPDDFPVEWALRWGQIFGMGGGEDLVHAIIATRVGEHFEDEVFWTSVLHFFINNPMLDPVYVHPIVDYIYNQRYVAPDIEQPDGTVVPGHIPQPDFTMKGRTVVSMLNLVEEWHGTLGKPVERKTKMAAWHPTNIEAFAYTDTNKHEQWTIVELLNEQELAEEGSRMHHCVRSYAKSCQKREVSIWSVRVKDLKTTRKQRVLTVAVRRDKSISQLRGTKNIHPDDSSGARRSHRAGIRKQYDLVRQGRQIMDMWIEQEGLKVLKQT